jgi:hypothetical protein
MRAGPWVRSSAGKKWPPHKDHNAGGKSHWMEGFWDDPAPPIWLAIEESNRHA